jgi:hypothetical protein
MAIFLGRGRPQMNIWLMPIACLIPKATDTHRFVILIVFSTVTIVPRTRYMACLVIREMECEYCALRAETFRNNPGDS